MRESLSIVISMLLLSQIFLACQARMTKDAESFPPDLQIEGLAGGVHPWNQNYYLLLPFSEIVRVLNKFSPEGNDLIFGLQSQSPQK